MKTIDIIIPAYNEEKRIGPVLRAYATYFDENVVLTVVLNGCRDNTIGVVNTVAEEFPGRIRAIDIPEGIGKGAAVVHGWKETDAEITGFVDADGATPPEEYRKLLDTLIIEDNVDGVIASRFIGGAIIHSRESWMRTVMSHGFITVVRLLFWMPFRDTQCGAKIFKRSALESILNTMKETGMVFDVELLWRLHKQNARVLEIPTEWTDKPGSASLGSKTQFLGEAAKMLHALVRVRTAR